MRPPLNEEAIFTEAIALQTAEERSAYVARVCPDNAARERIELLLRLHDSELVVDKSAQHLLDAADESPCSGLAGQSIGPYRLLEQIGEGGMGVVYLAEQKQPVRRRVALKVVKPGMDTKQVIARFESERQALALMEHPNIARVLDAGETDEGRPYFVMELVRGVPVTDYCRQERLGISERLELFIDTCHAVQHAHLKGVIHRDIKPSNVMVAIQDGRATVKMIDFGVAKAISQNLTDRTLFTNAAQLIGTPLYMSPEQAGLGGLDIDTRSDVYSLGVLLYELLTGTTPFDEKRFQSLSYDEMRRVIREEDPPGPGRRRENSDEDGNEPAAGCDSVEGKKTDWGRTGELDWIVLKALEKQRARRYQTVSDLTADVQRYLAGEPVEACPPSATYKLGKWLNRHRALVVSSSLVAVSLLTACCIAVWFAVEAGSARGVAEQALRAAEANETLATEINLFLREDLLGQASPYRNSDRNLRLREVLDRASERIRNRFADQPLVEAGIRTTLGTTYLHLGEPELAATHLERAHDLQLRHAGTSDPVTLRTEYYLGHTTYWTSGREEALNIWLRTLNKQKQYLAEDAADTFITMNWVGWCYALKNRPDLADTTLTEASEGLARTLGPDHPETLECLDAMTRLRWLQGRKDEAAALAEQVLEKLRNTVGEDHPQYQNMLSAIAEAKLQEGESADALAQFQEIVKNRRRIQGASHPETLHEEGAVARAFLASEQFDAAEQLFLDVLDRRRERYGDEHQRTVSTMRWLADVYRKRGDYANAVTLLEEVLEVDRRTLISDDELIVTDLALLADTYRLAKQHPAAARIYSELAETAESHYGPDDRRVTDALLKQLNELKLQKKTADMRGVVDAIEARVGAHHPDTLEGRLLLARYHKARNDYEQAEELFAAVWMLPQDLLERRHRHRLWAGINLADVRRRQGGAEKTESLCRQVLALHREEHGEGVELAYPLIVLAKILEAQEKWDEASENYVRAFHLRLASASHRAHAQFLLSDLKNIVDTLEQRKDPETAVRILGRIHTMLVQEYGEGSEEAVSILARQARTYAVMGDWRQAWSAAERELHLRREADWQKVPPINSTQFAASVLVELERFEEAESLIRRGLSDWESWRPEGERRFPAYAVLGDALTGQNRYEEAEIVLSQAYDEMAERKQVRPHVKQALVKSLIRLYEATGNVDRVRHWHEQLTEVPPEQ